MRVVQGLLLGLAAGSVVAASLEVAREEFALLMGACLLLSLVLWLVSVVRSTPAPAAGTVPGTSSRFSAGSPLASSPVPGRAGSPPGGLFAGRALGDALAWAEREHGVRTLYSVTVTEGVVDLLGSTFPGGPPVFLAITPVPGGWHGDSDGLPPEVDPGAGAGLVQDAFTAADLVPDVLSRLVQDARRQEVSPRVDDADLAAVIDRPHGLRDEVTVRVAADDALTSATWWGTADGRLLFVDRRAEV